MKKNTLIIIGIVVGIILVVVSVLWLNHEHLKATTVENKTLNEMVSTTTPTNNVSDEDFEDNRRTAVVKIKNKEKTLDLIVETIKKELDSDFDLKDYKKEISNGPDGKIYDFSYMIGDAKTTYGYTAMIENDKIEIYDNMGDFKEKINSGITCHDSLNDKTKINAYVKVLLKDYADKYKDYNFSLDSILKFYDEEKEKIVLHINIKMVSKSSKATSIITDTVESLDDDSNLSSHHNDQHHPLR